MNLMSKKNSIILFTVVLGIVLFLCGMCIYTGGGEELRSVRAKNASDTDAEQQDKEKKDSATSEDTTSGESTDTEADTSSSEEDTSTTEQARVSIPQVTTTYIDTAALASLTSQYSDTLKEKAEVQTRLNELMDSQNDFISKLREIDDMIIEYQDKIDDIDSRTSTAYQMMKELSDQVALAESQRDAQYNNLKNQIAQEYENGAYTYMDALFNATDYSDIVNKSEYIQCVDSYNNNILGQLTDAKRKLNDKNTLLASLTSDLKVLEEAYVNEQATLQILSDEKEKQVSMFQSSIEKVKGELSQIERLEQEQSLRISSMEMTYRVSVSSGVSEGGVKYAGGDFQWPCPSSTTITCPFGPREAPLEGASTFHKGMDIGCNTGANIVAAADGKVIHVGYMDINGNTVVIDHGSNISTVYAHLSGFAVNAGDTVKRGQTIAYAGSTGVSTGPHLHFAVRENGEYVNPVKYFSGLRGAGE